VAVTQRIQQEGEWRDGETSFFKVNVWRGQAEQLVPELAPGRPEVVPVGVRG
jgi:single-stranded DNA-binding protein